MPKGMDKGSSGKVVRLMSFLVAIFVCILLFSEDIAVHVAMDNTLVINEVTNVR